MQAFTEWMWLNQIIMEIIILILSLSLLFAINFWLINYWKYPNKDLIYLISKINSNDKKWKNVCNLALFLNSLGSSFSQIYFLSCEIIKN